MPPTGRKPARSTAMALFFWNEVLNQSSDFWTDPSYKRWLAEASRLVKEFGENLNDAAWRQACLDMKLDGKTVGNMNTPLTFTTGGRTYYEIALERETTPPPVYDHYARMQWELKHAPSTTDTE